MAIEQSRARRNLAALLGQALGSPGGIPDHRREGLREGAKSFAERLEEDAAYQCALELAALVREISRAGEQELSACRTILEGFAEYLRSRPQERDDLGMGDFG